MAKVDDRPLRFDHNPATAGPFDAARFESSLDAVLADREALDSFRAWILGDPMRTADALDLYFAIQGYKQAIDRDDPNVIHIAAQLHRRFVSLKTGTCDFIYSTVRVETSTKVHKYVSAQQTPPINLFDAVLPYVKCFLTQQHALFVTSNDFKDLVYRYSNGFGQIPPNDEQDSATEHCYVNEETFEDMGIRHPTTLASSSVVGSSVVDDDAQQASTSLSKPSHHRSRNNIHESLCLLKISPTSAAQTMTRSESHPGGGRSKLKSSKLEPTSSSDDPQIGQHREKRHRSRVGRGHSALKEKPHSCGMPHERPEQRIEFANLLTEKLNAIAEEIARLERQHGVTVYARQIPEYRQRALEQGQFPAPISVPYMNPNLKNPTMVGDTLWQPTNPMFPSAFAPPPGAATTSVPPLSMVAQSGYEAYDEDDEDLTKYEQKLRKQNNRIDRSNSISPAPLHGSKQSRFFASPYGNGGFAPPPPATSSKMHSSAQHCYPPFQHGAPFSYTNATSNGYLPQSSAMSFLSYSDSSGVFSAESAHVNLNSQPVDPEKMKRLYKQARETNAAQSAGTNVNPNGHSVGNSQTLMRTNKQSSSNATGNSHQSGSQTLPRPTRPSTTDTTTMSKMTVSLREPGQMAFVSKCERKALTFREFRRLFGISSNTTKRFFFKSPPDEDDTDLYQWTAVDRDDELVPIFEGKVTAECRTMPDSD